MVFLLIYQCSPRCTAMCPHELRQGHNSTKECGCADPEVCGAARPRRSRISFAAIVEDGSGLGRAYRRCRDRCGIKVGNSEKPFHEVGGTQSAGMITAVDGYKVLKITMF